MRQRRGASGARPTRAARACTRRATRTCAGSAARSRAMRTRPAPPPRHARRPKPPSSRGTRRGSRCPQACARRAESRELIGRHFRAGIAAHTVAASAIAVRRAKREHHGRVRVPLSSALLLRGDGDNARRALVAQPHRRHAVELALVQEDDGAEVDL
eukprot:6208496-Pleurochrysis_carterae.AAC.3